jgi:tetratricopeptide (TPR) repeat protein
MSIAFPGSIHGAEHGCNDRAGQSICANGAREGAYRPASIRDFLLAAQVARFLQFLLLRIELGAPTLLSTAASSTNAAACSTKHQGVWTMFAVRRLFAVGSVLTLIGLLASTHLWGQAGKRGKGLLDSTDAKRPVDTGVDSYAAAEMSLSRFADQPLVLYHPPDQKDTLLALQVKPSLQAVAPRPRDYLVLIDTAAHMAGGDLQTALTLLRNFLGKVGNDDRIALWTLNTKHHDLTNGFQTSKGLGAALKKLDGEYPSGAVNLRDSLPEAIKLFDGKKDRQHVLLLLGSGQSIAGPIDAELRASLCKDMVANHIAFYSVPLGGYLDPYNLHGFANCTGGKVVRFGLGTTPEKWVANLFVALSQPVLYDCEIQLPAKVAEALPAKLPPLRPDVPTLVVGKFADVPAKDETRFEYTLTGKVNGAENRRVAVSEKMPAPDEDNYFLVNMLDQWKTQKDRPALLQADRALDYAYENNQLTRADLVAQADWALEKKQVEAAARLYQLALKADPTSARAKAGVKLVQDLRSGKKTFDDIKGLLKFKKGETVTRFQQGRRVVLPAEQLFADPDKKDNPPPPPPDMADQNRINEIRGRQAIIDQEQKQIVDDAIRDANRMVLTRPDDAHEFLRRTLDSVRTNPDLSKEMRDSLGSRLERAIQNVDIQGAVVKRDQEEALRLMANANARTFLRTQEQIEQNNIRSRMRVYHNLMDQAREQAAYRQAQSIRKDLIDQGLPVPPAVTAGYAVGLAGYHLREEQELRRIREERWLAVLLEVERSHIPFPDEPPVEYPPAATWRALSEMRKGRYESSTFGADLPERGIRLRQQLQQEIDYGGLEDARATLSDALDQLSKRYNLTFDINEKAFEMDQLKDVARTPIADPTPIPPMRTTLSTVLRKILRRVPAPSGTTYVIRRDVIEITTGTFAAAEKTVRVYPVADVVEPIPQSFNPLMLMGSATIFGLSAGALGGFAGIGGLGGLGGAMRGGAMGLAGMGGVAGMVGLQGMGGLGGLGGIGGIAGLGGGGFNMLGQAGGGGAQGFQGNFQGQGNLGNGGVIGFGGQNLGQFGNLGGQFGLQGGDQSSILLTLIRQVVGRPRDWAVNFDPITGQPVNPLDDQANAPEGLNQENNQLGYFPPALALVVKGSSTIHTRSSNLIINPNAAVAALPKRDPKIRVANAAEERPDFDPKLDPKIVWQDALAKGVKNRGLIIATADFLVLANKFDHAVEFLKANLRQGIVVEPWVYKALAIALRMSGGSAEDIERAEVSTADMEPKNSSGYLEAATALAQDEKYGLALAFCRQAALLEPGTPHAYEDALGYAELARDAKSMQWAANNLLGHDWPIDNKQLHDRAGQKIDALVKLLSQQGRKDEAESLTRGLDSKGKRDLVIKLNWQGEAYLELHVIEPTGSACSPLHRQTIGGGVLIGGTLADMTSETYLAAEGFSGEYEIEIEKVWGHPLNNKAQLKIISHQGTPEEREQLCTVELKSRHSERIKVTLEGGRRTETAYVPPPSAQKKPDAAPTESDNPDKVMHQLRVLADPEVTGVSRSIDGGVVSQGRPVLPSEIKSGRRQPSATPDNDRTLYQTRIKPFVKNAMDVTASAVLSADRRSIRLSMTPVFNTVTATRNAPVVVNPTIPGAR